MAKDYTLGRAAKIERIFGAPFEVKINGEQPFRCRTKMSISQVVQQITEFEKRIVANGIPEKYSEVEILLQQILDPEDHARLHEGFLSQDPNKIILVDIDDVQAISNDWMVWLSGGDIPLDSSSLSTDGSSITGSTSPEDSQPEVTLQIT